MRRVNARRFRAAVALAAALGLLSACGGAGADEGGDADTFVTAVAASVVENMLPGESDASNVDYALFTPLTRLNPETGEVEMAVAEAVESTDQKVWTITIADGWTFHDGTPVTAQSFADSWNMTALGSNGLLNNARMAILEGYEALNPTEGEPTADTLSGVRVVDERTLEVTLNSPYSLFPYTLSSSVFAPVPESAVEDPKRFATHPVGNGPFMARDGGWEVGAQDVYLDRYDDYAGEKARAASVNLRVYQDTAGYYTDLQAGQLDVALLDGEDAVSARSDGNLAVIDVDFPAVVYLGFPTYDPRFANADLRRAISMAIDREAIVTSLLSGLGEPATGLVPDFFTGADQVTCDACAYDPDQAKRLLEQAGGWDGPMTLVTYQDPSNERVIEAVANQLRDNLGIQDVTFEAQEISQLYDGLQAQSAKGPALLYSGVPLTHVYTMANQLLTSGNSLNISGYDSAGFTETMTRAAAAATPEETAGLAAEAANLALADVPIAPLYFPKAVIAHSTDLGNVTAESLGGVHLAGVEVG